MGHHHYNHHPIDLSKKGERRLFWAVGANILLTCAQVIGGILSGSLSLIADAVHNFSDAASLLIALFAIKISKRPPDESKTFGYKRAETVAALINLTTLVIIGLYLTYEAFVRFLNPEPIDGWIVVLIAGIALIVDIFTALLTYSQSKHSMNIKAVFLHNLTDALASVGVIVAGTLILLYGWVWTDTLITLLIAGYILYQGLTEMPKVIHLLMEGAPKHINIAEVIAAMEAQDGIEDVHDVHIWQIDEHLNALEAHVVLDGAIDMDTAKTILKALLCDKFQIEHSTLEFENKCCEKEKNQASSLN